jgi:hypothetical protein
MSSVIMVDFHFKKIIPRCDVFSLLKWWRITSCDRSLSILLRLQGTAVAVALSGCKEVGPKKVLVVENLSRVCDHGDDYGLLLVGQCKLWTP